MLPALAQFTFPQLNIIVWGVWILCFLISVLILWLIIYTAVRAALSAHRDAQDKERTLERYRGD